MPPGASCWPWQPDARGWPACGRKGSVLVHRLGRGGSRRGRHMGRRGGRLWDAWREEGLARQHTSTRGCAPATRSLATPAPASVRGATAGARARTQCKHRGDMRVAGHAWDRAGLSSYAIVALLWVLGSRAADTSGGQPTPSTAAGAPPPRRGAPPDGPAAPSPPPRWRAASHTPPRRCGRRGPRRASQPQSR